MKVAAFLAVAGLVAAQNFDGQPTCAIPCLKEAIPKAGCAVEDTACSCKPDVQKTLVPIAGPCLISSCSADDLSRAQSAAASVCAKLGSGTSAATSAAATSSAASSGAETSAAASHSEATSAATKSHHATTSAATSEAAGSPTTHAAVAHTSSPSQGFSTAAGNSTMTFSKPSNPRSSETSVSGAKATSTHSQVHGAAATPAVGLLAAVLAVAAAL